MFSSSSSSSCTSPSAASCASPGAASSTDSMASSSSLPATPRRVRMQDAQISKGASRMVRDFVPTNIGIMLYGESGLGKTTAIKNLIGNWPIASKGAAFSSSGKTSLELFREDPDNLKIKLAPIRSEEANRDLLVTFQDMPGWGDSIDLLASLRTVIRFLLRQRQLDFHAQDGGFPVNGAASHRGCLENSITVCLYFIPPHRIKPVDWIMMAAISKLVAVVPVISKADTFTAKEMEAFRGELLQVIEAAAMQQQQPGGGKAQQGAAGVVAEPVVLGAPRTSGCGAATPAGIKSTVLAASNSTGKAPPMTPRQAAAARRNGGSVNGDTSPVAAKPEPPATVPAVPAAVPKTSVDGAAAASAGARPTSPAARRPGVAADRLNMPAAAKAAAAAAAKPVSGADLLASVRAVSRSIPLAGVLSESELASCIELVRELSLETYSFSADALEAIDATAAQLPPFAVVGSPDLLPADAPEVLARGPDGPVAGEPYRRYPWGCAFPLNRNHSDLIILKQLLTGHCNSAIYDLLDDSWRRACLFADKYRQLLVARSSAAPTLKGSEPLSAPGLLDSLVDEICSAGAKQPLQDRLRDEEQKKLLADYERASRRLRELEETVAHQRKALSGLQQLVLKHRRGALRRLLGLAGGN